MGSATSAAPEGRRRVHQVGRGAVATLAAVIAVTLLGPAPATAATPPFPTFTGAELKAFYYASLPLPGTTRITSRPPIYGHAGADRRIQQLAEARGYRLQVTPTVSLGSYGGVTLAADAGQAWLQLQAAARRNGTPLQGNSGYRSIDAQREIFRRRLGGWSTSQIESGAADDAIEAVLSYHSIPGYSRHHTAKTIDMSYAGGSNGSFSSSAAYRWISADNYRVAKTYGFIPNYPPGAGAQGPNPEPWEFVYIGAPRIRCAVQVVSLQDARAFEICGIVDRPLVGAFGAGAPDDVFVYRPGSGAEGLHPGTTSRVQANRAASPVSGVYRPVTGDFDGNGLGEILWYAPGSAADHVWAHRADGTHATTHTTINGTYRPIAGDFNGDGRDDIFWYAPGPADDHIWFHRADGSHATSHPTVNGTYRPIAGDFNGDGRDDIFWYAPGPADDHIWFHRADGSHATSHPTVNGTYAPDAGDFNGDGRDDVFWYAPGASTDFVWSYRSDGSHRTQDERVDGQYTIATGDHDADGYDDIVFLGPRGGTDWVWWGAPVTVFDKERRAY